VKIVRNVKRVGKRITQLIKKTKSEKNPQYINAGVEILVEKEESSGA